jgi:hypothetical protein
METNSHIKVKLAIVCIGAVEAKYGRNLSYEELYTKLLTEFPQEEFTLDEVMEALSLSIELTELQILYNTIGYG